MNKNIRISKINSKYVNNDCLQIKIPFFNTMTLFDNSKILFHAKDSKNIDINNYLLDERKKLFNDNAPIKYIKKFFKPKILFVNQIFDFNKPYILIRSGNIYEYYFSKVNNENLIIQKKVDPINNDNYTLKTDQLQSFFQTLLKCNQDEKIHMIDIDGNFLNFTSKDERKHNLNKFIKYLENNKINHMYDGHTLSYNNVPDKNKIPNTIIPHNKPIFVIKSNEKNITIDLIELTKLNQNNININIKNIPLNEFHLKQILVFIKHVMQHSFNEQSNNRIYKKINL